MGGVNIECTEVKAIQCSCMSQPVLSISHFGGVVNYPKAVYPSSSFYTFTIFLVMFKYQLETVDKQLKYKGLVVQEAVDAIKRCP